MTPLDFASYYGLSCLSVFCCVLCASSPCVVWRARKHAFFSLPYLSKHRTFHYVLLHSLIHSLISFHVFHSSIIADTNLAEGAFLWPSVPPSTAFALFCCCSLSPASTAWKSAFGQWQQLMRELARVMFVDYCIECLPFHRVYTGCTGWPADTA